MRSNNPSVPQGAMPAFGRRPAPVAGAGDTNGRRPGYFHGLFSEVQWTPGFIGLLMYVFTIVTYRAPLASPAIALALLGVVLSGKRVRLPGFLIVFGLFLLWGYIGYLQSPFPGVVWNRLVILFKLWIIAFAAVNTLQTRAQVRFFIVFFLVCFATHPARGAIFNYFYGYTVFGRAVWNHIFRNPNDLAGLTLLPLSMAIALLKDVNAWVRRGAVVSVVVLATLILMTQSRGGFLALALMALLVWQTQRRKLRALVGLVVIGSAAAALAPSGVWDRVSVLSREGTEADSSSRQRWEIWQVAREVAADHSTFGVGLGAYPYAHQAYTAGRSEYAFSAGYKDAHSTYLTLLAEVGWAGLFIFLLMVGIPLKQAWSARRRLAHSPGDAAMVTSVALALIGFMAAGLFATYPQLSFLYLHMALLSVLCIRAAVPAGARRLPAGGAGRRPMRSGNVGMPVAVRGSGAPLGYRT